MNTGDSAVVYGSWTQLGTSFSVDYSLPLFHEIDFFVNEGYRRIPHGGIELGGLLFGRATANGIRMEAFRPIACEHASGPSFKLSERDVAGLRKQIGAAPGQAELTGLQIVGWFIAHTRSELQMNDMEAGLFDELLPGPGKVTVLIKPEKFKATRFAFLVRGPDGSLERNGVERAFVLPLPGRAGGTEAVAPPAAAQPSAPGRRPVVEEPAPVPSPAAPPPVHVPSAPAPVAPVPSAPVPAAPVEIAPVEIALVAPAPPPVQQESVPPAAVRVDRREFERRRLARSVRIHNAGPNFPFAFLLFLAGLLGCVIGYWTYLQLPSAVIPLSLQPEPGGFTLSWPARLTRDAGNVEMRIDDGEPVLVPAGEKIAGRSEIKAGGDNVKVELIVRHWIRDSRGIVRFVGPAKTIAAPR